MHKLKRLTSRDWEAENDLGGGIPNYGMWRSMSDERLDGTDFEDGSKVKKDEERKHDDKEITNGRRGRRKRKRHHKMVDYQTYVTGSKRKKESDRVEEYSVDGFLKMDIRNPWIVEKIAETITAESLCEMPKDKNADHIEQIFKVNKKLKQLAETTTENTEFLQNLADKVEDLAVELLDQVHTKEEANIKDKEGDADRYGSLFSEMTKKAIIYGQKKFVSHPFLFKRVKMRWQRGSPFKSAGILHIVPRLFFIVLETILTPLLLPLIGYTFYRDQKRTQNRSHKNEKSELVSGGSDQPKEPRHFTQQDIDRTNDQLGLTQLERDQARNMLEMTSQDKEQTKDQQGLTQQEGGVISQDKDQSKDQLDRRKGQVEMTSQDREQQKEPTEMTKEDGDWNNEQGGISSEENERSRDFFEWYFDYTNTPLVIFVKTEFMKLVFIGLHCRICILGSSVMPIIEESLVFLFFLAVMLSEYEQWRTSAPEVRSKVYFKDMWNWVDLLTMAIYVIIVILRAIIIVRGGDPFHNRLLEIVSYCYGFNTMFLILRFSSILELSSVFGPLQLALFRMCVDLMIILVQFAFVVAAFSVAMAKIYSAEISYLMSNKNHTANTVAGYEPYCEQGAFQCLYNAARQLVWSVFGLMESTDLESHTSLTSEIVGILYLIFLILSVIMLTNWEVEWKFGLAVVEEQYARRHAIVIPYNLLTYLIARCYFAAKRDTREQCFDERKRKYDEYFRDIFFPTTTDRYLERYQRLFPLSVDEKLDKLQEKIKILEEMNSKVAMKIDKIKTEQKNVQDSERQLDQVRLDDRQVTNT